MLIHRLSVFSACAALSAACGGEASPTSGVPESVTSELPPGAVDVLARVSAEPAVAEDGNIELVTMPATPEPAAEGLGRWRQVSAPLHVTVATDGSGRTEIRIPGTHDSVRVSRVAPDGATSGAVEAALEGSIVRLREVVPHVDSLLFGLERGLEELWVLHRPEGRVEYELELPPGYALSQSSTAVEIVDARGRAKLRVLADKAWDAAGQELAAFPVVEGSRLRVEVEGDGTWPITVDPEWQAGEQGLQVARKLHAATLLADGRVLITGGISAGLATDAAEIYDPIGGHFEAIAGMNARRAGHTATLLRDATVLIAGGNVTGESATGELFYPVTRTFHRIEAGLQQQDRAGHTASLLYPDAAAGTDVDHPGIVLLAGGCVPEEGRQAWRTCGTPLRDAEVYDGREQKFISVGSMAYEYGRAQHTATLKSATPTNPSMVIFAGGTGVTQAASEVFLPAPPEQGYGRFEPAGSVGVGRSSHTATLLHDYKVLLVGNAVTQDNAESASVWDPPTVLGAAGTVTSLPPLHDVRSWHSATLLPTGRVVLAGGISSTLSASAQDYPPLDTVEHFDPEQGFFLVDGALHEARAFHTSTLLPNSTVLVTGGSQRGGGEHLTAEIFVAEEGSFSELGNVSALGSHTATLLPPEPAVNAEGILQPPQRLLIVGGGVATQPTELRELDIASGTAAVVGTLSTSRPGHTATLLRDGTVLIVGGGDSGASAELYRPASRELSSIDGPAHGRSYHTAMLLPNGSVLIAGGTRETAPVEIFDSVTGFEEVRDLHLPPLTGHTSSLLPDGRVLIAGGTASGVPQGAFFVYDPQRERVAQGSLSDPRAGHTATVLPSGGVLIAGGRASEPLSSAALIHFDVDRTTVEALSLGDPRDKHTATLLVDGRVLLIGGGPGSELYDPMANEFVPGPLLNTNRIAHTATLLPTAGVLVLGGGGDAPPEVWEDDTLHPDERRAEIRDIAANVRTPDGLVSVVAGQSVPFSGHSFTCMSEASGGRQSTSSTNHPVAYWMPLGGGTPSLGGVTQWSSTQGLYAPPLTPYPGPGLLFFITNGIRSAGRMVTVEPAPLSQPCSSGSECASGFCSNSVCCNALCDGDCEECNPEGACVEKADGTVCSADDGQPAHCVSRICEPGCTSNYDCPDGVCGVDGLCRNPITPAESSGCAVPARSGGSDGTFIAGLLLLAALGRRGASQILGRTS